MTARSFEEWMSEARANSEFALYTMDDDLRKAWTASRAALLADRPKVARVLSRLRDVDAPICDSGADTIESLAAQLAELEAELAKVKALIDSHNEECRNLCDAAREKNACGYANYYPKKNCPTCSEDWIIAYPKDAQ